MICILQLHYLFKIVMLQIQHNPIQTNRPKINMILNIYREFTLKIISKIYISHQQHQISIQLSFQFLILFIEILTFLFVLNYMNTKVTYKSHQLFFNFNQNGHIFIVNLKR